MLIDSRRKASGSRREVSDNFVSFGGMTVWFVPPLRARSRSDGMFKRASSSIPVVFGFESGYGGEDEDWGSGENTCGVDMMNSNNWRERGYWAN